MENNLRKFEFTFVGKKAEEIAGSFAAYYWDGGLDERLEQLFLEQFGLTLDDTEFVSLYEVKINTDNATIQ